MALPLAFHRVALLVIVLRLRRELQLVIALGLAGTERLGDGQHGLENPRMNCVLELFERCLQIVHDADREAD